MALENQCQKARSIIQLRRILRKMPEVTSESVFQETGRQMYRKSTETVFLGSNLRQGYD